MNAQPSVWIVDDDASIRWVLDKALSDAGWRTTVFDNAGDVLRQVQSENPDVIITDTVSYTHLTLPTILLV